MPDTPESASLIDMLNAQYLRWKTLIVVVTAIVAGAAAVGAWISVAKALPDRMHRVEFRLDSAITYNGAAIQELSRQVTAGDRARDTFSDQMELLLRLNCPGVARADLLKPCQPYMRIPRPE